MACPALGIKTEKMRRSQYRSIESEAEIGAVPTTIEEKNGKVRNGFRQLDGGCIIRFSIKAPGWRFRSLPERRLAIMKKAVGYLRRSTDKQEQSLEDQKREILAFAKREGFEMTGWYADDAISGAFSENRSQFQAMVQSAQEKSRPFDLIIAYDIARFSRGDNIEVGYYLHILRNAGVEVLYVKENLKGDDMDEILRPVFQFNANLYLKSLSRDTIRGQVTCAKEARFLGGPVPYGTNGS